MIRLLAALAFVVASAVAGQAQQLLESYTAYISTNDLYNSNGQRLNQPWQIIRQDRANYHRFGTGDPQDQWDRFFGDFNNRAAAEQMLMNGFISPQARSAIVNGNTFIYVEIWGWGNTANSIRVDVAGGGTMQGQGQGVVPQPPAVAPPPPPPGGGMQLITAYTAYIGPNDHYNSNGQRLGEWWQIIRQDRANYHRFGIRDPQDQGDVLFSNFNNRAAMEQMLLGGSISPQARNAIVNSNVMIQVEVWGFGGNPNMINVTVF